MCRISSSGLPNLSPHSVREDPVENWNVLVRRFRRRDPDFRSKIERNPRFRASVARLSRIHSNRMNPLSLVRPYNTVHSPEGPGAVFFSNFERVLSNKMLGITLPRAFSREWEAHCAEYLGRE